MLGLTKQMETDRLLSFTELTILYNRKSINNAVRVTTWNASCSASAGFCHHPGNVRPYKSVPQTKSIWLLGGFVFHTEERSETDLPEKGVVTSIGSDWLIDVIRRFINVI